MNRDNFSAAVVGIGVIALIVGFAIYFNSPDLNRANAGNQGNFVPAVITQDNNTNVQRLEIDKSQFRQAPELTEISGYINTGDREIKIADYRGKIVLVDFWTYSCINCIRTIPYLNDWQEKYADKGLVIIGVHSPEFEFEKDPENVMAAVEKFGIEYPVVQDNDKGTWTEYQNRYWPRKYLIDTEGYIRYDHIGEGAYAEAEKVIKSLLSERAIETGTSVDLNVTSSGPINAQSVDFNRIRTPELYFGYQFARDPLGSEEGYQPGQTVNYTIPDDIKSNLIYLEGKWKNNDSHMELQSDAGRIVLKYSAKAVNIVAGGVGQVYVSEDAEQLPNSGKGTDIGEGSSFEIDNQRLYNLVMHEKYGSHYLVIDVVGQGFQIYTFTFG